ncbi:MAG: hypothetical protein KDC98_19510, partial [Planctomycetes bacterium]|nr:hypothetical protein [Planctomycetota bacterium]
MHILRFAALTAATLLAATSATAQNYYSEDFDTGIAGWTITGGYENQWFSGATACGGVGGALQSNMYSGTPSCEITSPSISGMTAYGFAPKVLTYDYKCATWPSGNTTPAPNPWGSFDVQISSDGGVSWSTIETVSDEVQSTNCITRSPFFTTAFGVTDVIVRFVGNWTAGDYYLNIDNVSIDVGILCSGFPAPGDILVTGSICALGDSVDLSLEFEVPGIDISYEWYELGSPIPLPSDTPTITVTPTSLPATYYCRVVCLIG